MPVSEAKSQSLNINCLSMVAQTINIRLRIWIPYFLYNVLFSGPSRPTMKSTAERPSPFPANTRDTSASILAAGTEGEKLSGVVAVALDIH